MEEMVSPVLDHTAVAEVATSYGLVVISCQQLDSYDDRNYHLQVSAETDNPFLNEIWEYGYVLKIMNSLDSKYELVFCAQHELLNYLKGKGVNVPVPVKNKYGKTYSLQKFSTDSSHIVQLMTFIPGDVLVNTHSCTEILFNIGKFVGNLRVLLKEFEHDAYKNRNLFWKLENVLSIRPYLKYVQNPEKVQIVEKVLQEFEDTVVPVMNILEKGTIHGDVNENNLLVKGNQVCGLLDFGDVHYSACIFELAICICYMLLYAKDVKAGKHVIRGYLSVKEITDLENKILKVSVCARLCQSLVMGLYSSAKDPSNKYLLSSQKVGWDILMTLCNLTCDELECSWSQDG